MNFLKRMSGGIKKVLSLALVSVLLIQAVVPVKLAKAEEDNRPRFNFLNGNPSDKELLRGLNVSNNENDWRDPVSGQVGDTFAGIVYYHNGVLDTTATNTRVKVNLPTVSSDGKIFVTASVSADNASTITDTIIDGHVVGQSGLTINLDDDAEVEFVPGSVRWFPESKQLNNTAVVLPGGQSGDEIVSSRGVNIGAIKGCWDYAGYVTFLFKTVEIPRANIVESKIAKNLVTGQEGTDIFANPGDEVLYTLSTKNTGTRSAEGIIEDDINDILELSDLVEVSSGGTMSNGIVSYPKVTIVPGENVIRTFKVIVKDPQPTNARNGKHFDGVMENLYGNWVYVRIEEFVPGKPCLKIEKSVRNVTINETGFSKENQAKAGDILEYKITFSNSGEMAENLTLTDILPVNVSYIRGSSILSLNGKSANPGDKLTTDGIILDSLNKGESVTVTFKVKIASGIANGEVLVNTATLWFDKEKISDTAKTVVCAKPIPTTPSLPMTGAETPILSLLFTTTGALYLKFRKAKNALFLLKK